MQCMSSGHNGSVKTNTFGETRSTLIPPGLIDFSHLDHDLVRSKTKPEINERIDRQLERNIGYFANLSKEEIESRKDEISARIDELDHEWDVDRLLARNAAVIALTGVVLGGFVNRSWLVLPLAVTSFLFNHMQRGWCPPLPVLRRMGARTWREIETERCALRALRGDFEQVKTIAS